MKKCQFCAEEIQDEAMKCKHCGEVVDGSYRAKTIDKKEKPKEGLFLRSMNFGCALIIGFIILVVVIMLVSNSKSSYQEVKNRASNQATTINSPRFDVPALVGSNIDQIKEVLGVPEKDTEPTSEQRRLGVTEWEKSYTKDGANLLITYNANTRKVVDFFISISTAAGLTNDKKSLLTAANVIESDPRYKIEFVKAIKDPSLFTGVKIIPR